MVTPDNDFLRMLVAISCAYEFDLLRCHCLSKHPLTCCSLGKPTVQQCLRDLTQLLDVIDLFNDT